MRLPPLSRAGALALLLALPALAQESVPGVQDWERRDAEGQWVAFQQRIQEEPQALKAWVAWLAGRERYAFLEWIAVYHEATDAVTALAEADAPQWPRAAAWATRKTVGHSSWAIDLLRARPQVALPWLRAHRDQVIVPGSKLESLLGDLEREDPDTRSIDAYLPPLQAAEVLRHLQAPAEVKQLGARLRAAPGTVYLHQVQRALDGLVHSGLSDPPWTDQHRALLAHPHPRVRQLAFLTYTRRPPRLIPRQLARRVAHAEDQPALVRRAALLAFSYVRHPEVLVELHHQARTPRGPLWEVAVSRLGELGNAFTLWHLQDVTPADPAILAAARRRIRSRVAAEEKPKTFARALPRLLELAAWAELSGDPLETTLVPWTRDAIGARVGEARVAAALRDLLREYEPDFLGTPGRRSAAAEERARALSERVFRHARELLGE